LTGNVTSIADGRSRHWHKNISQKASSCPKSYHCRYHHFSVQYLNPSLTLAESEIARAVINTTIAIHSNNCGTNSGAIAIPKSVFSLSYQRIGLYNLVDKQILLHRLHLSYLTPQAILDKLPDKEYNISTWKMWKNPSVVM
jgi:hypothetical protein